MDDVVLNQCVEELKNLSREELIVTLFDTLTPTEKQIMLEMMFFKYYTKKFYK